MDGTGYSIWVAEYARCPDLPVSATLYGQHNRGTQEMTFTYTVLHGAGRTVLIDVGYDYAAYGRDMADAFHLVDWQSPEHVLGKIGLAPTDIDTVILTHAHFDHMGNLPAFPHAHFYLLEEELRKWLWVFSLGPRFSRLTESIDPQDLLRATRLVLDGRLTLLPSAVHAVLPGIQLVPALETHTYGSLYVVIENGASPGSDAWVVTGDNVFRYENVEGLAAEGTYVPIGDSACSQTNNLLIMDEMLRRAGGDTRRLIIGHEPRTWERFPSRCWDDGLHVAELCLADGDVSRIS